ncbi:MAG: MotA/TolQ/ExbB proton channel family protein [Rubripirellula sp.]
MSSAPYRRRLLRPQPANSRRQFAALASRILPVFVLAIGGTWCMVAMQPAHGQFPQSQNFNRQGFDQSGRYQTAQPQNPQFQNTQPQTLNQIPTIPSAAMMPNQQDSSTENLEAESEPWQLPAFVEKIRQGGWLMVPLGICSLIVFALSIERMIALRRGRVIPRPFVRRFTECVEDGQLSYEEATEICEEFDCPVAEVFQAAVRRWGRPMFEVEQAVMDAGDRVSDSLKRFLRVFHAISNVAPLLGLLGTVLGMIEAFDIMSSQESIGRPEMLASGISVALVTTAGGLSVAIPAYLAYMYFSSKSDSYLNEIDKLCQRVVDCISAEGLENAGNANRTSGRKRRAA